jgi:phosphopentomutase
MSINRVIIVIIDACGVGALPDADQYGDVGASTLPHIAEQMNGLNIPNSQELGLGNIVSINGVDKIKEPLGCFGKMAPKSPGKDSTSGHWEIAGIILDKPFPVFPKGFPDALVKKFEDKIGVKTIGNYTASGTEIIERLGQHHLDTKELILYTSADSVFQLAAHEDIYSVDTLYKFCQTARGLLTGEYAVGRVIARPFEGELGNFNRTTKRKDFSLSPPSTTLLDSFINNSLKTLSIGKIYDLLAQKGISHKIKTASNAGGMFAIREVVKEDDEHQLVFANLVDFDQLWGHRRDVKNFATALEEFDTDLGELLPLLRDDDLLIITADHGCDPTYVKHTDHTREYVPLLVYGKQIKSGIDLGVRTSFTDVATTIADLFNLESKFPGQSFKDAIL